MNGPVLTSKRAEDAERLIGEQEKLTADEAKRAEQAERELALARERADQLAAELERLRRTLRTPENPT